MTISWIYSLFYAVSIILLFTGLYLYKKSVIVMYGAVWIPLLLVLVSCYQTFVTAFLCFVNIPVNIVSVGCCNLLGSSYFLYTIWKKKEIQKYKYEAIDIIGYLCVIVLVLVFVKMRFGGPHLFLNYAAIDPATHFKSALYIMDYQTVTAMYHSALNNALFMECFAPFTGVELYYKLFLISDMISFVIAGFLFFGLLRKQLTDRFLKIAGLVIVLLYMAGYPLNTEIFGFIYLGQSITIIAAIIILMDMYVDKEIKEWFDLGSVMILCAGLAVCYILFAPVTYFAIITCIFLYQRKNEKLISWKTIRICLGVFLLPCLIGIYYTYFRIFNSGTTVSGAIVTEGGCYRDLYSDFLPLLPLAIVGIIRLYQKKKNRVFMYLCPYSIVFVGILFLKGMFQQVSSYYYYKTYSLIWLLLFVGMFYGILQIDKKSRLLIVSGFATWSMVFGICVTSFEEKVAVHNEMFCPSPKASAFVSIYSYNGYDLKNRGPYNPEKISLYQYVYKNLLTDSEKENIPVVAYWEDVYWYADITDQYSVAYEALKEDARYVVVMTDDLSTDYIDNQEYFDSLERVYENEAGYVAKLPEHKKGESN